MYSHKNKIIIDAVITWVDGSDETHFNKIKKYLKLEKGPKAKITKTRYNQVGEIFYTVASIVKFAPFVRKIFIVVDHQIPPRFDLMREIANAKGKEIILINHNEIFVEPKKNLPCFNSNSIEGMLQNIPGLAEHFIYFNDDTFLIKPTKISYWFQDGYPVIRGKWKKNPNYIWYKRIKYALFPNKAKRPGFTYVQVKAAKIVGYNKKYFCYYHTPKAHRKSVLKKFLSENPHYIKQLFKSRFRHSDQFNPLSLSWHLELKSGKKVIESKKCNLELHYPEKKSSDSIRKILTEAEKNQDIFCANLQSLDLVNPNNLNIILSWLEKITL